MFYKVHHLRYNDLYPRGMVGEEMFILDNVKRLAQTDRIAAVGRKAR